MRSKTGEGATYRMLALWRLRWSYRSSRGLDDGIHYFMSGHALLNPLRVLVWRLAEHCDAHDSTAPIRKRFVFSFKGGIPDILYLSELLHGLQLAWDDLNAVYVENCGYDAKDWNLLEVTATGASFSVWGLLAGISQRLEEMSSRLKSAVVVARAHFAVPKAKSRGKRRANPKKKVKVHRRRPKAKRKAKVAAKSKAKAKAKGKRKAESAKKSPAKRRAKAIADTDDPPTDTAAHPETPVAPSADVGLYFVDWLQPPNVTVDLKVDTPSPTEVRTPYAPQDTGELDEYLDVLQAQEQSLCDEELARRARAPQPSGTGASSSSGNIGPGQPRYLNKTDDLFIEQTLGTETYRSMSDQGFTICWERRRGRTDFGQYVGRFDFGHRARQADPSIQGSGKSAPMVVGSTRKLQNETDHARIVLQVYHEWAFQVSLLFELG